MNATSPSADRIVLLQDGRWPQRPGVCCWRHGVTAAFTAAGAPVEAVTWRPPASGEDARQDGPASRAATARTRLLDRLRDPARTGRSSRPVQPAIPGLGGAALVLAEGTGAAGAALASGVPSPRVWALVLPPAELAAGEPSAWADALRAVGELGGIVTDTDAARDVVERTIQPARTRVHLFPPLAADRPCPTCAARDAPAGPAAGAEPVGEFPVDEPGQLALWRRLLDEDAAGNPSALPYSYVAARLRGPEGPWLPPVRDPWGGYTPVPSEGGSRRRDPWSSADQVRCAESILRASLPPVTGRGSAPPRPVAVVGTDLSFIRELAGRLDRRPDLDLTLDEWTGPGRRTPGVTEPLVAASRVLVAEWARPNAIWLSEVKRPDQYLVVRLHRFEIDTDYPRRIRIENVDAVVHIAPLMGRRIRDELGWPADKLVYIPNFVDAEWLDRPKLPGARFTLGLVGAIPSLKRLDLALDLLASVRQEDPRFSLLIRGRMPWTHEPSWQKADERRFFERCFARIEADPLLRGSVVFDGYGRDMAAWFRKVGFVLSLSDVEGSHTALSEGMAAGCVPVVRAWPGARELYGDQWIRSSVHDAAGFVLQGADADTWDKWSAHARNEARRLFGPQEVVAAWADLLGGRLAEAAARFGGGRG